MELLLAIGFGLALGLVLLAWLARVGRRWWRRRRHVLWEDALKQIYSARQEGRSLTTMELGGRLGRSPRAVLHLTQGLEAAGLLRSRAGLLELTETGESLGLHVLRGHRLWERYLADEAQLPLDRLHGPAERAEHRLIKDDLDALADHLGHPRTDPHGDPIPAATGVIPSEERVPLTDWPRDRLGMVVHIEDEPPRVLREALNAGLRPGTAFRLLDRNAAAVSYETAAGRYTLAPVIAAHVHVRQAVNGEGLRKPPATLAELPLGERAEVLALSERCRGLRRRRLLDLGFTPGAQVEAVLASAGGSAHAYRIRGTVVALRREQAAQVLIQAGAAPFAQRALQER
jgi:DtxR family Mn-dependent transcriptional regulator